jgi:hypothetical protein
MRGKLAIENNEAVIYVSCKLGKQRVSVVQTSPSSNNHNVPPFLVTARLSLLRTETRRKRNVNFAFSNTIMLTAKME